MHKETEFMGMLSKVQSHLFTARAQLVLELGGHAGSMIFR